MKYIKHPIFWIVFGTVLFPVLSTCSAFLINFAAAQLGVLTAQIFTSYAWSGTLILLRVLLTVVSAWCAWEWEQRHYLRARLLAGIGGMGCLVPVLWLSGLVQVQSFITGLDYGFVVDVLLWPICLVAFGFLARQPAKDDSTPAQLTTIINPQNVWFYVGYVVFPLVCLTSELSIFALRSALGVPSPIRSPYLFLGAGTIISFAFGAPLGGISQFCANEWAAGRPVFCFRAARMGGAAFFLLMLYLNDRYGTSDWIFTFGFVAPPLLWSLCLVLFPHFARVPAQEQG